MRVYDTKEKRWVKEGIYLDLNNGDLYMIKKSKFGKEKLELVSPERYIWHDDIGLTDKNKVLIHEGDIVEAHVAEDRYIIGMITYASELSAYIILSFNPNEYYILGDKISGEIKQIGNVIENKDLLPEAAYMDM